MNTSRVDPSLAAPAEPLSKAMVRRIVFSSSVGNALEWFDFLVYGYFASLIAKAFFPSHDEVAVDDARHRHYGDDRKGRKAALTLMMLGTLAMAVMPTRTSASPRRC